jgi:hypothetical protein
VSADGAQGDRHREVGQHLPRSYSRRKPLPDSAAVSPVCPASSRRRTPFEDPSYRQPSRSHP